MPMPKETTDGRGLTTATGISVQRGFVCFLHIWVFQKSTAMMTKFYFHLNEISGYTFYPLPHYTTVFLSPFVPLRLYYSQRRHSFDSFCSSLLYARLLLDLILTVKLYTNIEEAF